MILNFCSRCIQTRAFHTKYSFAITSTVYFIYLAYNIRCTQYSNFPNRCDILHWMNHHQKKIPDWPCFRFVKICFSLLSFSLCFFLSFSPCLLLIHFVFSTYTGKDNNPPRLDRSFLIAEVTFSTGKNWSSALPGMIINSIFFFFVDEETDYRLFILNWIPEYSGWEHVNSWAIWMNRSWKANMFFRNPKLQLTELQPLDILIRNSQYHSSPCIIIVQYKNFKQCSI